MAQLGRGARQILEYLYADLDDIFDLAKNDPDTVRDLVLKCKHRIKEEIEPRLQRAAPPIEQRLTTIEERLSQLEQQLTDDRKAPA